MDLWKELSKLIDEFWNFLRKIFIKIINFFENIVGWFKDPARLKKLQQNMDNIAFAMKEKINNGNFNVVTGIFNTNTGEILLEDTVVFETEKLDKKTAKYFGDKDLILIK